jgi:hypothetical protein
MLAVAARAGVRRLLFRQADESTTDLPHMFKFRAAAHGPAALGLIDPSSGVDVEVDVRDAGACLRKGVTTQAKGVTNGKGVTVGKDQNGGGLCVKAL